jgi:hypothetical protein
MYVASLHFSDLSSLSETTSKLQKVFSPLCIDFPLLFSLWSMSLCYFCDSVCTQAVSVLLCKSVIPPFTFLGSVSGLIPVFVTCSCHCLPSFNLQLLSFWLCFQYRSHIKSRHGWQDNVKMQIMKCELGYNWLCKYLLWILVNMATKLRVLQCNAMQSGGCLPTSRRKVLPSSSRSKYKTSK